MKKTAPQATLEQWEAHNYPLLVIAHLRVRGRDLRKYEPVDEYIHILHDDEGGRRLDPKQFFTDPRKQREHLVKEIKKLYSRDKNRELDYINFCASFDSFEMREAWPNWHPIALGAWYRVTKKASRERETVFISFRPGRKLPGIPASKIFHAGRIGNMEWLQKFGEPVSIMFLRYYFGAAREARNMMDKSGDWQVGGGGQS